MRGGQAVRQGDLLCNGKKGNEKFCIAAVEYIEQKHSQHKTKDERKSCAGSVSTTVRACDCKEVPLERYSNNFS